MKAGNIVLIVLGVAAIAGAGYYFFGRKSAMPKSPKQATKADILPLLSESERPAMEKVLDQMSQQELNDTLLITQAFLKIEKKELTSDDFFKAYPGLQERMEAISTKYNIFT